MEPENLVERAARVHQQFKRGRVDAMGQGFWENWRPEISSLMAGIYFTAATLLLELSLWMDSWPEEAIGWRIPDLVALSLLLVLPFNGWFFDRFLSTKTPKDSRFPRWLLVLRFSALSLPLFGLHVLSFWRAFLERRAPTEPSSNPRGITLDLSKPLWRLPSGPPSQALYRSGLFVGWTVVSYFPVFVWALWLAGARELGGHRSLVLCTCILLHLAASLYIAQYSRRKIWKSYVFGWRRTLLLIAPVLWLFAIPGMVAGFAILMIADSTRTSLSEKIYGSRRQVNRNPRWQEIQDNLQRHWGAMPWFKQWRRPTHLVPESGVGYAEQQVMAFYRLKSLLLVLEGAALFTLLSILATQFPHLTGTLNGVVRLVTFGAPTLAGIGALIQISVVLLGLLKILNQAGNLVLGSLGRYLFLTQVAFVVGFVGASFVVGGKIAQFGVLFFKVGVLCAMLSLFFLLPGSRIGDLFLWISFFLSLSALGPLIALDGRSNQPSLEALWWLTALSPLWSLGLFLALGGWLLRPFFWWHVLDGRLPRRCRMVLGFTLASSVLPLGGLAIPFWIYARHKLWPSYERLQGSHQADAP